MDTPQSSTKNRAANLEEAFYTAQNKRLLDPNKPGPNASPEDRALYHYSGRRDPVGLIHEALDYYRLYVDMVLETEHPLLSALTISLVVRGPRDEPNLRTFMQGLMSLTVQSPKGPYQSNQRFDFMYHVHTDMESFDRYALQNLKIWVKNSERCLAAHIRKPPEAPLPGVMHILE